MGFFYREIPPSMTLNEAARRIRRAQATLVFTVLAISPAHTVPLTLKMAPDAGAALIAGALIAAALFAVLLMAVLMRLISVERMARTIEASRKRGKTPKILALPGILLMAGLTLPFGWFVLPRLLPEPPVQSSGDDLDACRRKCTDLAAADALKPGITMEDCIEALCR